MTQVFEPISNPNDWMTGIQGDWFVLRTKSRQEKAVAGELTTKGIANFLPLGCLTRHHGKRKARVEVPLFPGYVFLKGTRDEAFVADRTRRIAQIIPVADQDTIDAELRAIAQALAAKAPLDLFPYLRTGVPVEVRSGPLRGLRGVVESRESLGRVILLVDIIGTAVSVELDAALVDVLD
jgi:transcription antitermination factor NusG